MPEKKFQVPVFIVIGHPVKYLEVHGTHIKGAENDTTYSKNIL
jgi:hypothetical protein